MNKDLITELKTKIAKLSDADAQALVLANMYRDTDIDKCNHFKNRMSAKAPKLLDSYTITDIKWAFKN